MTLTFNGLKVYSQLSSAAIISKNVNYLRKGSESGSGLVANPFFCVQWGRLATTTFANKIGECVVTTPAPSKKLK